MSGPQDSPSPSAPQATDIVHVLAAVIERDGHLLICQRPMSKRHGGLWEFPGGKLEPAESWAEAAHREMAEELDVEVRSVGQPVFSVHDEGSPFEISFVPIEIAGEPRPLEHEDLRWLTIQDLLGLRLAPSDRIFAEWLAGENFMALD